MDGAQNVRPTHGGVWMSLHRRIRNPNDWRGCAGNTDLCGVRVLGYLDFIRARCCRFITANLQNTDRLQWFKNRDGVRREPKAACDLRPFAALAEPGIDHVQIVITTGPLDA